MSSCWPAARAGAGKPVTARDKSERPSFCASVSCGISVAADAAGGAASQAARAPAWQRATVAG